jgi:hypothetical protein
VIASDFVKFIKALEPTLTTYNPFRAWIEQKGESWNCSIATGANLNQNLMLNLVHQS